FYFVYLHSFPTRRSSDLAAAASVGVKNMLSLIRPELLRQQCYIDGVWLDADSGERIAVLNPANGVQLGTIPKMGVAETRRAIEAANAAWPAWRSKTAKERAVILRSEERRGGRECMAG